MAVLDQNDPKYPVFNPKDDGEGHQEEQDNSMKSNVKEHEHPYFSANGVMSVINSARQIANSGEEVLSGKIPDQVFSDIAAAARKTKVPYDFLLFACDWTKKMTDRSDGSDAEGIAKKLVEYLPQLRNSLGRDPMGGELFAAHVFQSASKVTDLIKKADEKPEEEVEPPGTQQDDILTKKKRGDKDQKRTNRELVDFFARRVLGGKITYKIDLGKDKYGSK